MTISSRALVVLSITVFLLGLVYVGPVLSESPEKDSAPEKSSPRPQQPQPTPDNQPSPPKPAADAKPQPPPAKGESAADYKGSAPEKSSPRSQQPQPAPDNQSSPPKPAADAKPQPPAKGESATDHKEGTAEKPATHKPSADTKPQPAPAAKSDAPTEKEKEATESKEKEPVIKKPLGSLILSVKLALMGDSRLFHYDLEAEDDQQTITLTGRVSTEEEKTAAGEIAQAVQGVKTVVNKLTVEKDLAKALLKKQDEILTTLIKERFSKSATLKAANFDVKTEDGVVQLNGAVRFQVIALEAAEAARQVPGVRAVNTEKVRLEGES